MLGCVFQIQRFSLYDGPGVRTVVFLKGCRLRCVWCHNPEGLCPTPQILYDPRRCIGCGACAAVCPQGCHGFTEGVHSFRRDLCVGCGRCAEACCSRALSVAGRWMSPEEVMGEVLRDLPFFRESGGGLTLSGGEPFQQPDFALALLRAAREAGISACVETSGHVSPEILRQAAALTDLFLYDCKATGEEAHLALCGVTPSRILDNLSLLDTLGASVTLRCPLVGDVNMTEEHERAVAALAAAHGCVREIHLEPYHGLGAAKARQLGQDQPFLGTAPARGELEAWRAYIENASGKPCSVSW